MKRKFTITLLQHEEGVSVSCPELPGCHSQGRTVDEAVENIGDAIDEYLLSFGEPDFKFEYREVEVSLPLHAEAARGLIISALFARC